MNRFEVIIPVINIDLLINLLKSIDINTLFPRRIIIINNSGISTDKLFEIIDKEITYNLSSRIGVYYSQTTLVNESLNLGITKLSSDCDYVSFLNDDIVLTDCFFQRNLELFQNKQCGVACPRTVHSMDELQKGKVNVKIMKRREGWAFSIRKNLLDKIPPFPAEKIATFHFDDWYWFYLIKEHTVFWFKDNGNVVYHHIGASVDKLGFKGYKKTERNEFNKIGQEKGWGRKTCG